MDDIYYGNESYDSEANESIVSSNTIITNVSGTIAGEWTTNLAAAKLMATLNKNIYIVNYGNLKDCSYCKDAEKYVFNTVAFKSWAKEKGIAMVYVDSNLQNIEPTKTLYSSVVRRYVSGTISFPQIILVGYDNNVLVGAFSFRHDKTINGVRVGNPVSTSKFIDIVNSYASKYLNNTSVLNTTVNNSMVIPTNLSLVYNYNINWTVPVVGGRVGDSTSIAKNGSVAGEWTRDIVAARALAKKNNVFYILNFGRTVGCALCSQADMAVYSSKSFKEWTKQNGIPLVYIDYDFECVRQYYNDGEYAGCIQSPLLKEIDNLYFKGRQIGFPTVVIIDGNDGKTRIAEFHVSGGISNWIRMPFNTDGFVVRTRSYVENKPLNNPAPTRTFSTNKYNLDWNVDEIAKYKSNIITGIQFGDKMSLLGARSIPVIRNNQTINVSAQGNFSSKAIIPGRWTVNVTGARDFAKNNNKFMFLYLDRGYTDLTINKLVVNQPAFLLWANKNSIPLSYWIFTTNLEKELNESRRNYLYASNPSAQGYSPTLATSYNNTIKNLEYIKGLHFSNENITTPMIFIIDGATGNILGKFNYSESVYFNGIVSYPNVKRFTEVIHSYSG